MKATELGQHLQEICEYGLVLAIDSRERDEALGLVESVGPMVDGIKLGVPTLLSNGSSIVASIRDLFGGPLIADLKVADIGFRTREGSWSGTNRQIIESAVSAGIDYMICHAIVGTSSLEECVSTAHSMGGRVLTLPYMTHQGAGLFFDHPLDMSFVTKWLGELGMSHVSHMVDELAGKKAVEEAWRSKSVTISDLTLLLGEELGVDGYIGPANRVEVLKDYRKLTSRKVVATGVGRQGGSLTEVYQTLGKNSAAILGHAIYDTPDPIAACKEFLAQRVEVTR
jgi:orotidine-5'-phosphate decarboxylase